MLRDSSQERNGIMKLKSGAKKLQKSLSLVKNSSSSEYFDEFEQVNVPNYVKEGNFAVIAANSEKPKRFVVPLSYLTHPTFLRLLEQAAEEYAKTCISTNFWSLITYEDGNDVNSNNARGLWLQHQHLNITSRTSLSAVGPAMPKQQQLSESLKVEES